MKNKKCIACGSSENLIEDLPNIYFPNEKHNDIWTCKKCLDISDANYERSCMNVDYQESMISEMEG